MNRTHVSILQITLGFDINGNDLKYYYFLKNVFISKCYFGTFIQMFI